MVCFVVFDWPKKYTMFNMHILLSICSFAKFVDSIQIRLLTDHLRDPVVQLTDVFVEVNNMVLLLYDNRPSMVNFRHRFHPKSMNYWTLVQN